MDVPTPQPDPTLVAEQQQAQSADTQQIQQSLGQQTQGQRAWLPNQPTSDCVMQSSNVFDRNQVTIVVVLLDRDAVSKPDIVEAGRAGGEEGREHAFFPRRVRWGSATSERQSFG